MDNVRVSISGSASEQSNNAELDLHVPDELKDQRGIAMIDVLG